MKLEAIEPTISPTGKLRLRFENGKTLLVPPAVIADLGLFPGVEIPQSAMETLREACGEASAKQRAVRIISAAPVTKHALQRRLMQKGESERDAQQAVQWLDELKLLDDTAVARQVVASGAAKGYGASRIRQMLYEKQVPKALWEEALAALPPCDAAIDAFLQRRFRGERPDRAACKRATDALLRRGHSWTDIRAALSRYAPDEDFTED